MHTAQWARLLVWVYFLLALSACAVGSHHTSDSELERIFTVHEADFETLLAQVKADDKLGMISFDSLRYSGRTFSGKDELSDLDRLGFNKERWAKYKQRLRELGVVQITKGDGGVEFRVDTGSLWNGDSYKGFEYSVTPVGGHQRPSLDKYRISEDDKDPRSGGYCVYKPLKGNWYLYLFVN